MTWYQAASKSVFWAQFCVYSKCVSIKVQRDWLCY